MLKITLNNMFWFRNVRQKSNTASYLGACNGGNFNIHIWLALEIIVDGYVDVYCKFLSVK